MFYLYNVNTASHPLMSESDTNSHQVVEPSPVAADTEVAVEAAAPAVAESAATKRALSSKQQEVLVTSNERRAAQKMERIAAKAAVEARARELLTKRFGADAVTAALQRRNGRPSREDSLVRSAAKETARALAEGKEVEEAPVPEEALESYAAKLAMEHLRRTPTKRRELESMIESAVNKYIADSLPSGMMMFGGSAQAAAAPAAPVAPVAPVVPVAPVQVPVHQQDFHTQTGARPVEIRPYQRPPTQYIGNPLQAAPQPQPVMMKPKPTFRFL